MTNGDDLPSLPSYQALATASRLPTLEEEEQIIAIARGGDSQAREAIITSCLGYVLAVARSLSVAYEVDYDELVGIGNLILVEKLDLALTKSNAYAYLKGYVKWQLIHECQYWRYFQQEMDMIAGPLPVQSPEPKRSYMHLYEAINRLPQLQRQVVMLHYGIMGETKHSLYQLSLLASTNPKGTIMYTRLQRALAKLRMLLTQTSACQDDRMYSAS